MHRHLGTLHRFFSRRDQTYRGIEIWSPDWEIRQLPPEVPSFPSRALLAITMKRYERTHDRGTTAQQFEDSQYAGPSEADRASDWP